MAANPNPAPATGGDVQVEFTVKVSRCHLRTFQIKAFLKRRTLVIGEVV